MLHTCVQCGKDIDLFPSQSVKSNNHFCSRACYKTWQQERALSAMSLQDIDWHHRPEGKWRLIRAGWGWYVYHAKAPNGQEWSGKGWGRWLARRRAITVLKRMAR